LDTECHLKVADFGLARSLVEGTEGSAYPMTEYIATRWYRAPEIVLGSNIYTKGVDMWAVGCIIAELYIGKPLFPGKSTVDQITKIMEITGKPTDEQLEEIGCNTPDTRRLLDKVNRIVYQNIETVITDSDDAVDLVKKLLCFSPKDRLTVEQAIQHPYVARFREEKDEIVCNKQVYIPIDVNTKRSVDVYRQELFNLSKNPLVKPKEEDKDTKKSKKSEPKESKQSEPDTDKKDKAKKTKDEEPQEDKTKKGKDKGKSKTKEPKGKGKGKKPTKKDKEPTKKTSKSSSKDSKGKTKKEPTKKKKKS